jgi:hypothetical protein
MPIMFAEYDSLKAAGFEQLIENSMWVCVILDLDHNTDSFPLRIHHECHEFR